MNKIQNNVLIYDVNFDISSNINNIGFDVNNDLILHNVYNKISDKQMSKYYDNESSIWHQNIIGLYSDINNNTVNTKLRPFFRSKKYGNTIYKLEDYNYDKFRDFINSFDSSNLSVFSSDLISWSVKLNQNTFYKNCYLISGVHTPNYKISEPNCDNLIKSLKNHKDNLDIDRNLYKRLELNYEGYSRKRYFNLIKEHSYKPDLKLVHPIVPNIFAHNSLPRPNEDAQNAFIELNLVWTSPNKQIGNNLFNSLEPDIKSIIDKPLFDNYFSFDSRPISVTNRSGYSQLDLLKGNDQKIKDLLNIPTIMSIETIDLNINKINVSLNNWIITKLDVLVEKIINRSYVLNISKIIDRIHQIKNNIDKLDYTNIFKLIEDLDIEIQSYDETDLNNIYDENLYKSTDKTNYDRKFDENFLSIDKNIQQPNLTKLQMLQLKFNGKSSGKYNNQLLANLKKIKLFIGYLDFNPLNFDSIIGDDTKGLNGFIKCINDAINNVYNIIKSNNNEMIDNFLTCVYDKNLTINGMPNYDGIYKLLENISIYVRKMKESIITYVTFLTNENNKNINDQIYKNDFYSHKNQSLNSLNEIFKLVDQKNIRSRPNAYLYDMDINNSKIYNKVQRPNEPLYASNISKLKSILDSLHSKIMSIFNCSVNNIYIYNNDQSCESYFMLINEISEYLLNYDYINIQPRLNKLIDETKTIRNITLNRVDDIINYSFKKRTQPVQTYEIYSIYNGFDDRPNKVEYLNNIINTYFNDIEIVLELMNKQLMLVQIYHIQNDLTYLNKIFSTPYSIECLQNLSQLDNYKQISEHYLWIDLTYLEQFDFNVNFNDIEEFLTKPYANVNLTEKLREKQFENPIMVEQIQQFDLIYNLLRNMYNKKLIIFCYAPNVEDIKNINYKSDKSNVKFGSILLKNYYDCLKGMGDLIIFESDINTLKEASYKVAQILANTNDYQNINSTKYNMIFREKKPNQIISNMEQINEISFDSEIPQEFNNNQMTQYIHPNSIQSQNIKTITINPLLSLYPYDFIPNEFPNTSTANKSNNQDAKYPIAFFHSIGKESSLFEYYSVNYLDNMYKSNEIIKINQSPNDISDINDITDIKINIKQTNNNFSLLHPIKNINLNNLPYKNLNKISISHSNGFDNINVSNNNNLELFDMNIATDNNCGMKFNMDGIGGQMYYDGDINICNSNKLKNIKLINNYVYPFDGCIKPSYKIIKLINQEPQIEYNNIYNYDEYCKIIYPFISFNGFDVE